jgi:Leucine-rich repeat (LRR) protein
MPNLKFLEIDGELSDFPADLKELKSLSNLILLRISLKWPHRFPKEILELSQLRCLDLSDNMISGIAPDLPKKLPNLRELYMSGNDIKLFSLPAGRLTQLECLDLSDNRLIGFSAESTLPAGLSVLDISHNKIECFQNVVKQCTDLKRLKLEYNYLSSIPVDWLKVAKVKRLSVSSYTKIDDETKRFRDDITWTIFDESDAIGCN